jgi:hypothetical protein
MYNSERLAQRIMPGPLPAVIEKEYEMVDIDYPFHTPDIIVEIR